MGAIQVKNVPPDLHEQIRTRASVEGRSVGDYVLDVLQRDLAVPSTREWLEGLAGEEPVSGISSADIVTAIDEGRGERDAEIRRAIADSD